MFSCSLSAGMTTATVASRQSSAGAARGVAAADQPDDAEERVGTENERRD